MKSENKTTIIQTTDPQDFIACAIMMAKSDPWITLGMNYDQCIKAFEGDLKEIYVVLTNKEITGFVILQMGGTFKGYIQTICISEAYRGKGIGKKLLQYCEKRILMISPNIFICVSSFNKGAIKLYTEFGFKQIGELENFVKEGFTELLLRKTIGPLVGYTGIL
jgi:ribosomal protein S18 acetylase RimI-like enzyme